MDWKYDMIALYIFENNRKKDDMMRLFQKVKMGEIDREFSSEIDTKDGSAFFFTSIDDFHPTLLRMHGSSVNKVYVENNLISHEEMAFSSNPTGLYKICFRSNAELHYFDCHDLRIEFNKQVMTVEEERAYLIKEHQEKIDKEEAMEKAELEKQMKLFKDPFYGLEV